MHTDADIGAPELERAFASFTAATARLEYEYAALRARAAAMQAELEEKNRLLVASVERERALEAQALRQSRLAAMGEMAAMLAHEVRNPLGAMELFTGLLLQDLRDRPEQLRLAREVARSITDLSHLVTNLLEFTRTQAPRRAPVDVGGLVDDALRYGGAPCAAAIRVERRLDAAAVALGDGDLLRPVFTNLVRNALEAMPTGGTLTVAVAREGDVVRVTVADTGPGIPEAERAAIFRPFYTTRARGTGLGLAVARDLVAAMHGTLDVDSAPGRGATFTVTLPTARTGAGEPNQGERDVRARGAHGASGGESCRYPSEPGREAAGRTGAGEPNQGERDVRARGAHGA
jgi:signal transduction histidine kinase